MLITSRTPLRISLFGGGTDYPDFFEHRRGAVVGMTINQYIYIHCLQIRSFLSHRYRISYSKLEVCQSIEEIQHPVIREVLKAYKINIPLHISTEADLPANTGLGSSSSFTVGFLNLISRLKNEPLNKIDLAKKAVFFEKGILQEHVGVQDQYHASFGGLNRFDFTKEKTIVQPIQIHAECQKILMQHAILVYTGLTRSASTILDEQLINIRNKKIDTQLNHLLQLVDNAVSALEGNNPTVLLHELGAMLHDSWLTKQAMASTITNPTIDRLYNIGLKYGAYGGKLCGAGGGGFILLLMPPEKQAAFSAAVSPHAIVPIDISVEGSTIIYNDINTNNHHYDPVHTKKSLEVV